MQIVKLSGGSKISRHEFVNLSVLIQSFINILNIHIRSKRSQIILKLYYFKITFSK